MIILINKLMHAEMNDAFVNQVSERYIELFEKITGEPFVKADISEVFVKSIAKNSTAHLRFPAIDQEVKNVKVSECFNRRYIIVHESC